MQVTVAFAERLADVARLLDPDDPDDQILVRLTALAVDLVPGCTAAAVTIATPTGEGLTFAASDAQIQQLHDCQFAAGGPVVEVLRHNEPRRVDDARTEQRWERFVRASARVGLRSCLVLPLRTDRQPAAALALYASRPHSFSGASHDVAVLFAAQGGTAVLNHEQYRSCRQLVRNLHVALESRAVIEQAKGMLHARLGVDVDTAFERLRTTARNSNTKLRDVAARLVAGELTVDDVGS